MEIRDLIEIHRREKVSPYLQNVGDDFYDRVKELIRRKYSNYLRVKDEDISKVSMILQELENIRNIIIDIYETRERKIVTNALYYVKSGEKINFENLTREENELLKRIIEVLKETRKETLNLSPEMEKIQEEIEEEEEQEEGIRYVTVRILQDLPAIVGIDGKIYGDFKAEDIVTLPEPNARALINRGEAQEVKK